MDATTRVRTALALERPDRPPAAWWGHTFREEWSARELAAVTVERQRSYGWDFVKLQPRACCFAEALGSEYRPSGRPDAGPELVRPAVRSPDDWDRLSTPEASVPALDDQVDALAMVVEQVGPTVPVIQTVFSPLTVAGYLVGEDKAGAAAELQARPEVVEPALARIAGTLADFAVRSVGAGAAGIFYAISGYASADLLSRNAYERLALPHDRAVLDAVPASAWFTVLHLCGSRVHFDLTSELPVSAISWSVHEPGNPSLIEGRARSGRAVMGGIDHVRTLPGGSVDEVAAEARAAVSSVDIGLLLAPGCSVPVGTPEANLRVIASRAGQD